MGTLIFQTKFEAKIDSEDRRNLAYLLYELSFSENISQMKERLRERQERRTKIQTFPGLKESSSPLEPQKIHDQLCQIYQNIKQNYNQAMKFHQNRLNATKWTPTETTYYQYFQYWLRQYAEKLIQTEKKT